MLEIKCDFLGLKIAAGAIWLFWDGKERNLGSTGALSGGTHLLAVPGLSGRGGADRRWCGLQCAAVRARVQQRLFGREKIDGSRRSLESTST
jgi:hypothetical protein